MYERTKSHPARIWDLVASVMSWRFVASINRRIQDQMYNLMRSNHDLTRSVVEVLTETKQTFVDPQ